ncbi:ORMDL family, partial [Cladochytrium replicatum]
GSWITNLVMIVVLRFMFSIVPGLSTEAAWTLMNVVYNTITFFMFHWFIGTPFDLSQGEYENLTLWEQIDNGAQFTPAKKYLTAVPISLFLLSTHYTHYDFLTFMINLTSLVVALVPKLPQMHRVRLFGVNNRKYPD